MSIKYVILGYLNWQPMTGYDVKKLIASSETLPWSANNNQLYRALVDLHKNGWVTKEIEQQTSSPNRHIYTATDAGRDALKDWVMSAPDPPLTKRSFLHQLMWADGLNTADLQQALENYRQVVGEKLFFLRVHLDEKKDMPERTPRESLLWEAIYRNWLAHYELELKWITQTQQALQKLDAEQQRQLKREQRAISEKQPKQ